MKSVHEVTSGATNAIKETSKAIDKLGSDGSKAPPKIKDKLKDLNEEQKNTQTETQETGSKFDVFKKVGNSALESIQGGFDGLLGKIQNISPEATAITETLTGLGVGGVVGVTAVAGAIGGMALAIKTGVNQATELDDAMAKFQAQTGASSNEMSKFKNIARDVWSNNFGEDISDVADMMARVKQQMQGISDVDLKDVTEDLLTLRDTFGMDENETLRGAQQLMKQFGITSQEAFDLMATGAQNGLNKSDELGDNISEYSGKFKQAGYSAEEYFQLMQNGLDGGAYNLDKVNDAINEVTTRLVDGNIEGALESFDTKTQDVFKAWQEGRKTQKDVVNAIVEDISRTTNQQEKLNKTATAFGTMGEDFNAGFIESLTTVGNKYKDVQGAMDKVKDIANGGLKNALSGLGRAFLDSFTPIGELITPILAGIIGLITVAIQGIQQGFAKVGGVISSVLSKIDTSGITELTSQVSEVLAPAFDEVKKAIDEMKVALEPIAKEILGKIGSAIQNVVNQAQKILSVVGPPILAIIKKIIQTVVGMIPVITSILQVVGSVVSGIISFITMVVTYVGTAIATILGFIMPIVQIVATIVANIWSVILTVAQNIWSKVSEVVTAIIGFVSNLFKTVSDIINKIWSKIQDSMNKVRDKVQGVIDNINKYFNNVKSTVSDVFNGIWSKVQGVMDNVGNKISNVLQGIQNAWSGLKGFVGGVFGGIEGAVGSLVSSVKGMVNGVIGGINGAISIINKIPGVHIGRIPRLERGGVLKRGQIGLLEGNGAEAVVPLEKNKAWIRAVAKDMAQIMPSVTTNNNGQTINFYNKAQSPDEIARMLRMQARYGYGGVVQ
ncbi:phage tail tape measure protein [Holdemanella sp.]|uniref:phage tail tape measure protein n=1 Tax=Holdemanella sp. TaxID=1971762 RepID=UPI0030797FAB